MDDAYWRGTSLVALLMSNQMLVKLYQKGLITADDVRDVHDQMLLNLETNQAIAGGDAQIALAARAQIELMIRNLRTVLPPPSA